MLCIIKPMYIGEIFMKKILCLGVFLFANNASAMADLPDPNQVCIDKMCRLSAQLSGLADGSFVRVLCTERFGEQFVEKFKEQFEEQIEAFIMREFEKEVVDFWKERFNFTMISIRNACDGIASQVPAEVGAYALIRSLNRAIEEHVPVNGQEIIGAKLAEIYRVGMAEMAERERQEAEIAERERQAQEAERRAIQCQIRDDEMTARALAEFFENQYQIQNARDFQEREDEEFARELLKQEYAQVH
jgi:hypothetical protein